MPILSTSLPRTSSPTNSIDTLPKIHHCTPLQHREYNCQSLKRTNAVDTMKRVPSPSQDASEPFINVKRFDRITYHFIVKNMEQAPITGKGVAAKKREVNKHMHGSVVATVMKNTALSCVRHGC